MSCLAPDLLALFPSVPLLPRLMAGGPMHGSADVSKGWQGRPPPLLRVGCSLMGGRKKGIAVVPTSDRGTMAFRYWPR
jgi:hypothetical protein